MMITDAQTQKVYFSSLLKHYKCWETIASALQSHRIDFELSEHTRDIWIRDFMPIQLDESHYVGYLYSPDYLVEQPEYVTNYEDCMPFRPAHLHKSRLRLDGGNVVKCDNRIIMVNKVINENVEWPLRTLIHELEEIFQAEVVIVPWDPAEPYGHADGMVRYLGHGKVLINNYHDYDVDLAKAVKGVLRSHFEVEELRYGKLNQSNDTWAYLNYLQVGQVILIPQLNCQSDALALEQIAAHHPGCEVIPIPMRSIVKQGGGMNCISWNVKL
jgi:agmatine/peptidylarginine deiminase